MNEWIFYAGVLVNFKGIVFSMILLLPLIFLVTILVPCAIADPDPSVLTLPVYQVYADAAAVDSVLENNCDEIEIAAELIYGGVTYEGHLSLRGASARYRPKKSWEFEFATCGPNGIKNTNLNADFRDATLCRNFLAMKLADYIGLPAPEVRHISLFINDEFMGVFTEVENIDDYFFEKRNLSTEGLRLKSIHHAGRLTPLMNQENLDLAYQIKQATQEELDTFRVRTDILQWASPQECAVQLPRMFDIHQTIQFYALNLAITNDDGYTKNFILFENPDGRYGYVLWDADASLGFDWEGLWKEDNSTIIIPYLIRYSTIFVRLVENESFLEEINARLRSIATNAFPWLEDQLDDELARIANDVSFDEARENTMEAFWGEGDSIHVFLQERGAFLQTYTLGGRGKVDAFSVEHDYMSSNSETNTFKAHVAEPSGLMSLWMGDAQGNEHFFGMFDNGTHGDFVANDNWFTITVAIDSMELPYYYCFLSSQNYRYNFPYPSSGKYDYLQILPQLPTIRDTVAAPSAGDLELGPYWLDSGSNSTVIAIVNTATCNLDINGCNLSGSQDYHKYTFFEEDLLEPGDTLFISNRPDLEQARAPWRRFTGRFFLISQQDSLFLSTSSGKTLDSDNIHYQYENEYVGKVVINEFNYNGKSGQNPGDWIELASRYPGTSIAGWTIRDEQLDHIMVIPDNADELMARHNGYLVIAEDIQQFKHIFPMIDNVIGDLGFGLGNNGDDIVLYDTAGNMVDLVRYSDHTPWPVQADGQGPTLELHGLSLPNAGADNWDACLNTYPLGTPGTTNSKVPPDTTVPEIPDQWNIGNVYPNPFNSELTISIDVPSAGKVSLVLYNILGQEVDTFEMVFHSAGYHRALWRFDDACAGEISSGVYFLQLVYPFKTAVKPVVLLK